VPKKSKVGMTVESLGTYLREQRVAAELSLRQLAEQAGVSNPYLSQIERGLRRPSAEVLQALAKALRISAEQVYVQAGILNPDDDQVRSVELAILGDPLLSERQKQALLEVYAAFRSASVLTEPQDAQDVQFAQTQQEQGPLLSEEEHAPTDVETGDPGQATSTEGI
jgi:transcriptional regulator with XRE-family HTH domain